MAKHNTVTPASEWRKLREGELLSLPTGRVVRVRRPQIEELLLSGKVPNPLLSKVLGLTGNDVVDDSTLPPEQQIERFKAYLLQMKALFELALVEPRLSDDPDDDEAILFTDLTPEEKDAIVDWLYGPMKAVQGFRK